MAFSPIFLLVLIGSLELVNCQFDRNFDRERIERERQDRDRLERQRNIVRPAEGCVGKVMDVFFLLDSSSSIYINDYMSQHRLVRDIINRFDVSPESTRVGMLTFSDDLERPVMGLNRYPNRDDLVQAISMQNLPYRTGMTNTHLAISYARQDNDFRPDITKVLIVFTDGGSRSPGATSREAELARNAGFYLFVVGIGQYIEEREWRAIASDPDDQFVYNITNARFMEDVKFSLPPRACALPPIIFGGSCNVNQPSEVYFVSSRSASQEAIDSIDYFKSRTRSQRNGLRVSYLIEACGSVTNVAIDDQDVACERFAPSSGDTQESVSALMDSARSLSRDSRNDGANQVIVIFADDASMALSRFDWTRQVNGAKNAGVTIVVVDAGLRTYKNFARDLASEGKFIDSRIQDPQRSLIDQVCAAANRRASGFEGNPR